MKEKMMANGPSTPSHASRPLSLLISAGPTQEPIDEVRFIGNRSSGRLGMALATEACARGHRVTLLLGPVPAVESHEFGKALTGIRTHGTALRFRTTADLERCLAEHAGSADVIVMSAAVADYRPKQGSATGKIRRVDAPLAIELEPTPDLLGSLGKKRKAGQLLVGFALEPKERLLDSARAKLERKAIDLIVANPLETMESDEVEARVLGRRGEDFSTNGRIGKDAFAPWLLDIVERAMASLPA